MIRSRPGRFAALIAVLSLGLAACSGAGSSPSASDVRSTAASPSQAAPSEAPPSEAAPSESAATASEERVRLKGSQFDPSELTIAVGTEVTFVNADGFTHTVTEGTDGQAVDDPIVDEEIQQNGTVKVTFDEPGTYDITCKIHPSMHLTITVEG